MSSKLTMGERAEKVQQAVAMSVKGVGNAEIGEALGVSRQTIWNWLKGYYAQQAEHRDVTTDREEAIAHYREIIAEGWRRLESMDNRSLNVSGLINSIKSAQDSINKLTGSEAPQKFQNIPADGTEVVWADGEDVEPAHHAAR